MSTIVKEIVNALEILAPTIYQESYDNVGLLIGNEMDVVSGILISLDCTEEIVDEAIKNNFNVIVSHHPILFKGLKNITGKNYVEKVIIKAIKNNISIIACHTNIDNMQYGVNAKIASKLGMLNCNILQPLNGTLKKLYLYAPENNLEIVRQQLFDAGAGQIGLYSNCSFNTNGIGTFMPMQNSNPKIGQIGNLEKVNEVKIEVLFSIENEKRILQTIANLTYYEEKAYEIIALQNKNQTIGAGIIGDLPKEMPKQEFLNTLKDVFKAQCIRYTNTNKQSIRKVAICGGSGSFLIQNTLQANADAFITADVKYHEFFDAENKIMIADIGHFESEQYTSEIFYAYLREKFTNFAIQITNINTNPINYF